MQQSGCWGRGTVPDRITAKSVCRAVFVVCRQNLTQERIVGVARLDSAKEWRGDQNRKRGGCFRGGGFFRETDTLTQCCAISDRFLDDLFPSRLWGR